MHHHANPQRQSPSRLIATTSVLCLLLAAGAEAADINLVSNGNQWQEDNNQWSDGNAASAGNDYFVGGLAPGTRIINRNFASSSSFAGDSLTLGTGGELGLVGTDNGVHTVNLILNGGRIDHDSNQNDRDINLAGTIEVIADSVVRNTQGGSSNKSIGLNSAISGDDKLTVTLDDSNDVILRGVGTTYTGTWDVDTTSGSETGGFIAQTAGSLGTGTVDIGANVTFNVDYDITSLAALILDGVMILDQNHTVSALTVDGSVFTPGTYTFAQLNAAHDGNFADSGNGSITVIPEPASLVLLGLGGLCLLGGRKRQA